MRHSLRQNSCVLITVLTLALAGSARAQVVENDLRLVADQAGAPPNVMILFDTSGSMNNMIWHEDFDPNKAYFHGASCTNISVSAKSGTSGQCPGSGLSGDSCPNNENTTNAGNYVRCELDEFANACAAWTFPDPDFTGEDCVEYPSYNYIYFRLPYVNNQTTWWGDNYASFLVRYMRDNGALPSDIPAERRIDGGKRVIEELIESINPDDSSTLGYDERVRFGLARLDGNSEGGYVVEPIADGNKDLVIAELANLPASGGTPVSEALVDVGRYFVGEHDTLGTYPQYDRNTFDGDSDGTIPSSPLDAAVLCRGNFVIVISDGEPTSDSNNHHGTAFTNTFGSDYDNDGNSDISTDALDDVAAYLFEEDLIDDTVMPGKQNIITYTIGFALDTKLLNDTAINGDGAYFPVSTTDELAETLAAAVEEIILRNATFTAASVPTSRSVFGDGFYTAFFEPRPSGELYRGHLQAYRIGEGFDILGNDGESAIDPDTGEFLEPRDTYFWDAAETLLDPNNTRNLYFTPTPTTDPNSFVAANLTATDLSVTASDLTLYPNDPNVPFATIEDLADAIVNYVRGQDAFDKDRDTDTTELRSTVLGDIFHSNPQLVGQAPLFLAAEEGYGPIGDPNSFLETYALRDKVLYAGANDGMLHAFDAGVYQAGDNPDTPTITENGYYTLGDGVEIFGYVPGLLLDKLKEMPLTGAKPYYVDGQIVAADAWFPSTASDVTKEASEWTTTLIAGMRNGARGYLALDVTNPEATTAAQSHGPYPKFLWEFNDPAEPLGLSWSRPIITRVKLTASLTDDYCGPSDGDGAVGTGPGDCRERWVAIFGGGYLPQGDPSIDDEFLTDPNDPDWENASKAIFMVAMDTGQVIARAAYDATDAELQNMKFSMPSEPAVLDLDFDGFADVVYIGDTGGQMWKWDISAVGTISGTTGRVPLSTWPVGRFFVSPVASNGHYRSFFFPPSASLVEGDLVLAFGTGERTDLEHESTTGVDENHFYVVRDDVPTGANAFLALPYGLADITELNDYAIDPDPADQGYYLVADEDEKFVSDSLVFGGFVITASYTPDFSGVASGEECEAKGDATLYIFRLSDGQGYFDSATPNEGRRVVVGSGLPTSPSITVVDSQSSKVVLQTSDGRVITFDGPAGGEGTSLIYWRQVQ